MCVQDIWTQWLRRISAVDTPQVRIKRRAIAAGTSRHRIVRRTFVMQTQKRQTYTSNIAGLKFE